MLVRLGGAKTVLVTGNEGYLGAVLTPILEAAGFAVKGVDTGWYRSCVFGALPPTATKRADIRDLRVADLEGFDAVIHLAALSNDPVGNLQPACTRDINHLASVQLARNAKAAGVRRFLFASSCSLYGFGDFVDETAPFQPLTVYGETKQLVEADLAELADDEFSPTYLRNATVYGYSPAHRIDLVVNNLAGYAHVSNEILIKSDGTPWRPLIHCEDAAKAFLAVLTAPAELVHDQPFNVGSKDANYRVADVAELVQTAFPAARIVYAPDGGPDKRDYRVDFSKLHDTFPKLGFSWTVEEGARQLRDAYEGLGLDNGLLTGRLVRIHELQRLLDLGSLTADLRWAA